MVVAPIRRDAALAGRRAGLEVVRAGVVAAGLAGLVGVRFVAARAGLGDPIAAGLAFGLALLVLAALDRALPRRAVTAVGGAGLAPATGAGVAPAIAIGLAGGAALVGLALVGRWLTGTPALPELFRPDLFPAWALATIVVAAGEEAVLRGALLDRLQRAWGPTPAILLTSLAFALMHVPFYGWRIVPLDAGVGLWLAGLRLASRGLVAPTIAHAMADLATWWL